MQYDDVLAQDSTNNGTLVSGLTIAGGGIVAKVYRDVDGADVSSHITATESAVPGMYDISYDDSAAAGNGPAGGVIEFPGMTLAGDKYAKVAFRNGYVNGFGNTLLAANQQASLLKSLDVAAGQLPSVSVPDLLAYLTLIANPSQGAPPFPITFTYLGQPAAIRGIYNGYPYYGNQADPGTIYFNGSVWIESGIGLGGDANYQSDPARGSLGLIGQWFTLDSPPQPAGIWSANPVYLVPQVAAIQAFLLNGAPAIIGGLHNGQPTYTYAADPGVIYWSPADSRWIEAATLDSVSPHLKSDIGLNALLGQWYTTAGIPVYTADTPTYFPTDTYSNAAAALLAYDTGGGVAKQSTLSSRAAATQLAPPQVGSLAVGPPIIITVTSGYQAPAVGTWLTDSAGTLAEILTLTGTGPYTVTLSTPLVAGVVSWPAAATLADSQPGVWAASITTAIGKWTGITSLANWLRAMTRKSTPDATAASEINTGGGTYDATAKSLEAHVDGGGNTVVNVLPGNVVAASGRVIATLPPASQYCVYETTFPVIDQSGNPINLTGIPLTLEFWDPNMPTVIALTAATAGTTLATIVVGGTNHNQITLTITAAANTKKANWTGRLRPTDNSQAPYLTVNLPITAGPPI